jgi:hypothetical protein
MGERTATRAVEARGGSDEDSVVREKKPWVTNKQLSSTATSKHGAKSRGKEEEGSGVGD